MKLSEKDRYGRTPVLDDNGSELGSLSTSCCGVDFHPKDSKCTFVILGIKMSDSRVFDCVEEIEQLDLDNLSGVFNYKHPDSRGHTFERVKAWFDDEARKKQGGSRDN